MFKSIDFVRVSFCNRYFVLERNFENTEKVCKNFHICVIADEALLTLCVNAINYYGNYRLFSVFAVLSVYVILIQSASTKLDV